ncbi:hypothetical protein D2Q93_14155 [Alicyclobacillaceae bacterium I2511]|nr:hypothetical protein D2Q93_14155 [Alicyclobacillaceae bacterium I2511]
MGADSLSHTRWDCSYPIIFIPKFRRKVFFKETRKEKQTSLRTEQTNNPLQGWPCDYTTLRRDE